jgi:Cof subfamily protein (haloacid dehalogenase superfamily)
LKNSPGSPRFKLIAIDCDGTLLDSDGNLAKGAPQAVKEAIASGIKIALVTGRSRSALGFIFDQLDVNGLFIGSGGAYIGDLSTGEVIQQRTLPREEAETLIHLCRKWDLILFLDHFDFMLCEKESAATLAHKDKHSYIWKKVADLTKELEHLPEKGLVVGEPEKLQEIYRYYQTHPHEVSITFTSPTSMDVLPKGVGKGDALVKLASHFEIPLEQIAVIGDYLNDLEMFQVAGYSIAMGNAPDKVKRAANWVAPANNEDGASHAIRHLLRLASERR